MATFSFALGALLVFCGLGGFVLALNLVPTDMGMLYAICGVIFIGCGAIVLAIAALTQRLSERPAPATVESASPAPSPANATIPQDVALETEPPEPADNTHVIGRYSSAAGRYLVFADGGVEAETPEGVFRFATLNDFKAYVASRTR